LTICLCIATVIDGLARSALEAAGASARTSPSARVLANGAVVDLGRPTGLTLRPPVELPSNVGIPAALDRLYRESSEDVLFFIHDDVLIYEEDWDGKLLRFFDSQPRAALIGLGGAKKLDQNLVRHGFRSRMRDWRTHGQWAPACERAAVIDGFAFAARRSFLDAIGGFAWWPFPHHGYDYALGMMAIQHGWEIWIAPFSCDHLGSRTAVHPSYVELTKSHGGVERMGVVTRNELLRRFSKLLPVVVP
jgi:hypothetical protein